MADRQGVTRWRGWGESPRSAGRDGCHDTRVTGGVTPPVTRSFSRSRVPCAQPYASLRAALRRLLGDPGAVAAHKAARAELERVGEADVAAGRRWETEAYLDANDAVIEAERHVPRWRR